MGIADFIPAEVEGDVLLTELGMVPRPLEARDGAKVEVMVRPDDISIHPEEAGQGRVVERVFQGAHNLYKVELPSGTTTHSLRLHYQSYYDEGETVSVTDRPRTRAHVCRGRQVGEYPTDNSRLSGPTRTYCPRKAHWKHHGNVLRGL